MQNSFENYLSGNQVAPFFVCQDSLVALKAIPDESIDMCMTSPPYWGKREYGTEGIGLEKKYSEYLEALLSITDEIKRVLKPSGSFWLNIGDSYFNKALVGLPWRVAIAMSDEQKWILRNDIIWNKLKGGMDNSKDRLRNIHENIFHFVKNKKYYYDIDAIRLDPAKAKIKNGAVVSATGVSGVRYKKQIERTTMLSDQERMNALKALDDTLNQVRKGEIADFRMVIRGVQRTTHSNSTKVSGRAKELQNNGFYFLRYHPKGSKPNNIWNIIPEDTQKRKLHFAPYPEELCKIPLLATCPDNGVVLDPFCGTGTTMIAARRFGFKSIGLDIDKEYIELAMDRCEHEFGANIQTPLLEQVG